MAQSGVVAYNTQASNLYCCCVQYLGRVLLRTKFSKGLTYLTIRRVGDKEVLSDHNKEEYATAYKEYMTKTRRHGDPAQLVTPRGRGLCLLSEVRPDHEVVLFRREDRGLCENRAEEPAIALRTHGGPRR